MLQVLLIDDLADTCFTLLNAVTQLVRVGGAKAVYVFVSHAVLSQMPQVKKSSVFLVMTNLSTRIYFVVLN